MLWEKTGETMLIANMGLFWKRDDVFWGKQNNSGRLLGVPRGKITSPAVNFRWQTGIYALYAEYRLVYVGQVRSKKEGFFKRLKMHAETDELKGRWDSFSWFGLRRAKKNVPTDLGIDPLTKGSKNPTCGVGELLDILEGALIDTAEPPLNGQGGRFDKYVSVYVQKRDDNKLDPPLREAIKGIDKRLDRIEKKVGKKK